MHHFNRGKSVILRIARGAQSCKNGAWFTPLKMNSCARALRIAFALLLTLVFQARADLNVVRPSNFSQEGTRQANEDLQEQVRIAQEKYDQERLEESNHVEQARQYKISEQQRLQQILAGRIANPFPSSSLIAADIEQVVHRVDPELPIASTTNHGVIRYKVSLKTWAQREDIYAALDQIQKLGISAVQDPPSVTVSVDERSLPRWQRAQVQAQPMPAQPSELIPPRLALLREDPPTELATAPEPKSNLLVTLAVLATLAISLVGIFGLWRLRRREQTKPTANHSSDESVVRRALYQLMRKSVK